MLGRHTWNELLRIPVQRGKRSREHGLNQFIKQMGLTNNKKERSRRNKRHEHTGRKTKLTHFHERFCIAVGSSRWFARRREEINIVMATVIFDSRRNKLSLPLTSQLQKSSNQAQTRISEAKQESKPKFQLVVSRGLAKSCKNLRWTETVIAYNPRLDSWRKARGAFTPNMTLGWSKQKQKDCDFHTFFPETVSDFALLIWGANGLRMSLCRLRSSLGESAFQRSLSPKSRKVSGAILEKRNDAAVHFRFGLYVLPSCCWGIFLFPALKKKKKKKKKEEEEEAGEVRRSSSAIIIPVVDSLLLPLLVVVLFLCLLFFCESFVFVLCCRFSTVLGSWASPSSFLLLCFLVLLPLTRAPFLVCLYLLPSVCWLLLAILSLILSSYSSSGVCYLETDVGQPELCPSGMITLHRITQPLIGLMMIMGRRM